MNNKVTVVRLKDIIGDDKCIAPEYWSMKPFPIWQTSESDLIEAAAKASSYDLLKDEICVLLLENETGCYVVSRPVGFGKNRFFLLNAKATKDGEEFLVFSKKCFKRKMKFNFEFCRGSNI